MAQDKDSNKITPVKVPNSNTPTQDGWSRDITKPSPANNDVSNTLKPKTTPPIDREPGRK